MRKVRVRLLRKVRILGKKHEAGKQLVLPIVLANELVDAQLAAIAEPEAVICKEPSSYSILKVQR